ncbi:MAG TPA: polysaccharide biosynthesis tyrosine autokinase [Pyrinomonadaceae bacterium]|jgi:capsular exopolysaccharide synthesis family protein|nr:polysaccharide biosynthesis tyrosine autokinase [Pyrinomonadaceae bacterium]
MSQDNRLMPMPTVERTLDRPLSDIGQLRSYGPAASEPSQIRDYLFVVLKRKWLILSLCLVVTSLVAIQMFRQPSIYEASTTIRIQQRTPNVLQTRELVVSGQPDPNFWGTQIKLLESPTLARQVALSLDLQHNPNFFGGQSQGGIFAALKRMVSGDERKKTGPLPAVAPAGLSVVGEAQMREEPLTPEELAALEPYEDAIIAGESVDGIVGTNLFRIKYSHTDPELAQKVANTIAEVFRSNNIERITSNSSKAEDVLIREINTQQDKIRQDTEALFNYARETGLPPDLNSALDVEGQRLAELSRQALDAQKKRQTTNAVYLSAAANKDPLTVPDVQKSERVANLQDRISGFEERLAALKITYTDDWPEVKKVKASIERLKEELKSEANEAIGSLKAEYDAAVEDEKNIQKRYLAQRAITDQQSRDRIEMAAYSQRLEAAKQNLSILQQKYREIQIAQGDKGSEIAIESYSRVPRAPVGPPRIRNVVIAFLLSLVAGVGLAFLLDFLDDTVKSLDDVDRYVHLPALAMIPASGRGAKLKGLAPVHAGPSETTALAMIDDVRSPIAESYRHLRTSLLLSSAGQPPKTILVTSSQPSEGKTTTAINTAFMLAQTGAEVLIIDCDLRRPRLHTQFEVGNSKGLTTWLSGEKDLDNLLQIFPKTPNLKILTSGPVPPNPAELLGSEEMRRLLGQLSERFAHIIIDSPPAISFTDASILSTMVDGVMLVVHGGRSSRAVVRRAKQQLLDVGAHIFGVVLNNVRMEQQDYYYSGYYSNYYSTETDSGRGTSAGETA